MLQHSRECITPIRPNIADQAALPDFPAGATEDWGLVLYREANLLYEPGVTSADNKRSIAAVIAHELSHMVFGNLLTCQWWSDTWLNEGLARFLQYEILHDIMPQWKLVKYCRADFYLRSIEIYIII